MNRLLKWLFGKQKPAKALKKRRNRLDFVLERLEDRAVPAGLQVYFDTANFFPPPPQTANDSVYYHFDDDSTLIGDSAGQIPITLTDTNLPSTNVSFLTLCYDIASPLVLGENTFDVTASLTPDPAIANSGKVGLLYNHFGIQDLLVPANSAALASQALLPDNPGAQAAGLQVAVWTLAYPHSPNVGFEFVSASNPLTDDYAAFFLNYASANGNESVVYLIPDGAPISGGKQGMLAPLPEITTDEGPTVVVGGTANLQDTATVTGGLNPTGSVTFNLYDNPTATGPVKYTETVPLVGGTVSTAVGFPPAAAGTYYWVATFNPDNLLNLPVSSAPDDEPINAVDAKIEITPSGFNEINVPHQFTITVTANPAGTGTLDASNYTTPTLNFSPGSPGTVGAISGPVISAGGNVATYTVTINNPTPGVFTVSATGSVTTDDGVVITRTTDGTFGSTGPAVKTYEDAYITIGPSETNLVGQPHTFTVSLFQSTGGPYVTAPANTPVTVTLTSSAGASITPISPAPNSTTPTTATYNLLTNAGGQVFVTFSSPTAGTIIGNAKATFVLNGVQINRQTGDGISQDSAQAVKKYIKPGIDIEKMTAGSPNYNPVGGNPNNPADYDNEDAPNGPGVPILNPGSVVTWYYKVKNTGQLAYQFNEVVVVDDNGTPGDTSDDLSTTSLNPSKKITFDSVLVGNGDTVLDPGEEWRYKATGIVQNLGGGSGGTTTFDFSGSSGTTGSPNIRNYTSDGISVNASAFSRTTGGSWAAGWLGAYGGGLGVTDTSEDGSNPGHTVDNVGRFNYVLFEFNQNVVIDSAFLGYVVGDSDLTVWIGTIPNAYNSHQTLNDGLLSGLYSEENLTTLTSTRTANLNDGAISGNVVIIAAWVDDDTPDDKFKIEKVTVCPEDVYENKACVTVTTVPGLKDCDLSHYRNPKGTPGIDIEKTTIGSPNYNSTAADYNNEDSPNGPGVPLLNPGDAVTWQYKVKNTGTTIFTASDVVIVDDNGTPGNAADDLSTTSVNPATKITFVSVVAELGTPGFLDPNEEWIYKATGTVQNLGGSGGTTTFDFSGSSGTTGSPNVRNYTSGGISVNASAFSRTTGGSWAAGWLGAYGGGLGVTDTSEDGSNPGHTVDNVGRFNYVLFEFNQNVVIDSAFLGYVVGDSDLTVWIGTIANAYNSHQTLNDGLLAGMYSEENLTTLTSTRTADLNGGALSGNVVIIAAWVDDDTPDDKFKIEKVTVKGAGVYENKAKVSLISVPGLSDSDLSHYKNAPYGTSCISGTVFVDCNNDAIKQSSEVGIQYVTITLTGKDYAGATVNKTTKTDAYGKYSFSGLLPSNASGYKITEGELADYIYEGAKAGSTGGTTGDHTITTVVGAGANSTSNNFAELQGSTVSGGKDIAYWTSSTGQTQVNDGGSSSSELAMLNALYLKNSGGTSQSDFASYAALKTYLAGATSASSTAYKLSVDLALMQLNVEAGFVNANSWVLATNLLAYESGTSNIASLSVNGYIKVSDLMSLANSALSSGSSAYQAAIDAALNAANNNNVW